MALIFGTNGSETLDGTSSGDLIFGRKGNDTINAGDGNDLVFGGKGDDTINGGAGNDLIFGGKGDDIINGGAGNDVVFAGKGDDVVAFDVEENLGTNSYFNGGKGNDTLHIALTQAQFNEMTSNGVFAAFDLIAGSNSLFDFSSFGLSFDFNLQVKRFELIDIEITDPINEIIGTSGDDKLTGTNGADIIRGLEGNDRLFGLDGDDQIFGGDGNDLIRGGTGTDQIFGGDGNDLVFISDLNGDSADGGAGSDTIVFNYAFGTNFDLGTGVATLDGGGGSGTFVNFEHAQILGSGGTITATNNANNIVAFGGSHTISLLDSNDVLQLNAGGDIVDGGNGVDRVVYLTNDDVSIDLSTGVTSILGVIGSLTSVEWVETRGGDDTITGSSNGERIAVGTGTDTISAGDGNDNIFVSDGGDIIDGGAGANDAITIVTTSNVAIDLSANSLLIGTDAASTIFNIEQITTGSGDDIITGNASNNTILANVGDDIITGGGGNDTIRGDLGNDTFIMNAGDGNDRIIDFSAGVGPGDVMDIQDFGFTDIGAVQSAVTTVGSGVLLQLDATTSVMFDGLNISDFVTDDFVF